jgi:thiamine transporter
MFLYSNLLAVSEQTTETVKWISVGGVIALLAVIALIGYFSKEQKATAKELAFAGICVALSFALSVLKVKIFASGGSITFGSLIPIMLYAYAFGPTKGFIVGVIHGLLNFIESPYILSAATFLFDYLLAFIGVGIMGFFGKMPRKKRAALPLVLGAICVIAVRFCSHLCSGVIFFEEFGPDLAFPTWAIGNGWIYSFIYQISYVGPDMIIALAVIIILSTTKTIETLDKIINKNKAIG